MKVPCTVKFEEISYATNKAGQVLRQLTYVTVPGLPLVAEGDCFSSVRKALRQQLKPICEERGWVVRNVQVSKTEAFVVVKDKVEQKPHVAAGWAWKKPPATTPDVPDKA